MVPLSWAGSPPKASDFIPRRRQALARPFANLDLGPTHGGRVPCDRLGFPSTLTYTLKTAPSL